MESWDPQAEVIIIAGELGNSHIHELTDCSPFAKAVLKYTKGQRSSLALLTAASR